MRKHYEANGKEGISSMNSSMVNNKSITSMMLNRKSFTKSTGMIWDTDVVFVGDFIGFSFKILNEEKNVSGLVMRVADESLMVKHIDVELGHIHDLELIAGRDEIVMIAKALQDKITGEGVTTTSGGGYEDMLKDVN